MLSLRQVTPLIANAFQASSPRLEQLRTDMVSEGLLPAARGRSIPPATPKRLAYIILALGVSNAPRIGELADLRAYITKPGDLPFKATLADTLALLISDAMTAETPVITSSVVVTLTGTPYAYLENSDGERGLCFGERETHVGYVQRQTRIHLGPLGVFASMLGRKIRETQT